ncbi:MAG TPA: hypothetical protein VNO33_16940, partial [Kofleriaceae bacterium]|nr:hypothetical protein [Kofleriaceae bacterium]
LLEEKGVVGLVGRLPKGLVMDKRDRADGLTHNWHVERDGKKRVLLYAIEYGVVREALLGKVGDSWKLVELRDADHGEP